MALTESQLKNVKKGSVLEITYDSSIRSNSLGKYIVSARNKVRKGKVDKITMTNVLNLSGVKSYIYIYAGDSKGYMALGDMGVSVKSLKIISK